MTAGRTTRPTSRATDVAVEEARGTRVGGDVRWVLSIADPVLASAMELLLRDVQHRIDRAVAVGDLDADVPLDVVVVDFSPIACQKAIARVVEGRVAGVITTDRLAELGPALFTVMTDLAYLPNRVVEMAQRAPELSDRDQSILRGLLAGDTSQQLAHDNDISPATLKRTFSSLMQRLGADNRAGVAAAAYELGLRPRPERG